MTRQTKKNIVLFAISFTAALLASGALYLFLVNVVNQKTIDAMENEPGIPVEQYLPSLEDSITVLFMGMQSSTAEPGMYSLLRFDPKNSRASVCVLPANIMVDNNGSPESLSEVYTYGGAEYTKNTLAKSLGISIDRYVRITHESFVYCAGVIGSIDFLMPKAVTISNNGAQIDLKEGVQLLDGSKLLQIITHNYADKQESLDMLSLITASIITEKRDIFLSKSPDSLFERIINKVDSDISYNDYYNRKPALEFFAKLETPEVKILKFHGSNRQNNNLYIADDTFIAEVLQYFS